MKIYKEMFDVDDLIDYLLKNSWSGARDRIEDLQKDGKLRDACECFLSIYGDNPEYWSETELNDFWWFEDDFFNEFEKDEEELEEKKNLKEVTDPKLKAKIAKITGIEDEEELEGIVVFETKEEAIDYMKYLYETETLFELGREYVDGYFVKSRYMFDFVNPTNKKPFLDLLIKWISKYGYNNKEFFDYLKATSDKIDNDNLKFLYDIADEIESESYTDKQSFNDIVKETVLYSIAINSEELMAWYFLYSKDYGEFDKYPEWSINDLNKYLDFDYEKILYRVANDLSSDSIYIDDGYYIFL